MDRAARRRMHVEALSAAGLGVGMLGLSQGVLLAVWGGMPDPGSEGYGLGMVLAYTGTTVAEGMVQNLAGSAIIHRIARARGRADGAPGVRRSYGWALLGQSSAWLLSVGLGFAMWKIGPAQYQGPETTHGDVVRHYMTVVVMPELLQVWGGSYFGAFLVERRRAVGATPSGPSSVTVAPYFHAGPTTRPEVGFTMRGSFGA